MSGELIQFPIRIPEPLEPVSELVAVKPELWARLLGSQALADNPNIVLGSN